MKTIAKVFLTVVIFLLSANAEHINIQLLETIKIKDKQGEAKAQILLESDKTKKENYILKGKFTNKRMMSGKTKITINWHTATKGKAVTKLSKPFESMMADNKDIKAKQEFRATGDKASLEESLNKLINNSASKEIDKEDSKLLAVANGQENSQNNKDDSEELSGDTATLSKSKTSDNSNNTGNNPSSTYADVKPDNEVIEDSIEEAIEEESIQLTDEDCNYVINGENVQFRKVEDNKCVPNGSPVPIFTVVDDCKALVDFDKKSVKVSTKKIATFQGDEINIENCSIKDEITPLKATFNGCDTVFRKDKVAQVQQEQLYYTYDTADVKVGNCVDSTTIHPVSTKIEVNELCKPMINFEAMEVQFGYRKIALLGEEIIELEPCKFETTKNKLISTYDGAEIKDDFINGKSIQYEILYYIFNGKNVYVGEPRASKLEWKHYLTDQTCSPERINAEAVIYNQRVAYKDNKGIIKYISSCKPYSDNQLKIIKEFGGYEHDFNNNQSYPKTREYFLHPDTQARTYINDFKKEAVNFPHIKEHIRWSHDDKKLMSTEYTKAYFNDTIYAKTNIFTDGANGEEVASTPVAYAKNSDVPTFSKSLGKQRLKSINGKYSFYSNSSKVIDHSNGFFPSNKNKTYYDVSSCTNGDIISSSKSVSYEECTYNKKKATGKTANKYCKSETYGYYFTTKYKTVATKNCSKWKYIEDIAEYKVMTSYLRVDGSNYTKQSNTLLRIVK